MSKKININVNVADKVASVIGAPTIVCGNSNYTITFMLDAEWETSNAKTARFVFRRDGEVKHIDVAFSGRVVGVPELANIDEVYVGLYAGELYTSTPARIICKKSIKCGTQQKQEAPAPDVYQQILQTINNLDTLPTVSAVDAGRALMVNEDGRWVVRLPNFIYDQNSGDLLTFFIGTVEEWNAWTGDKAKCIFFPTDLNLLDEVEAEFEKLWKEIDALKKGLQDATSPTYRHNITVECYGWFMESYAGGAGAYQDYIKFTFSFSYDDKSSEPNTNFFKELGAEYSGEISYSLNGDGTFTGSIKRAQETITTDPVNCFIVEGSPFAHTGWFEGAEDGGEVVRVTDNVTAL